MKAQLSDRIARLGVAQAVTAFESIGLTFREQHESDYGIDAHVELIENERPTGRLLGVQVKSGPSYLTESIGDNFVFRTDAKHVNYWTNHALPVLVCLADIDNKVVYWQLISKDTAVSTGKLYKVMVPRNQVIDQHSLPILRDMLTMIIPSERYTLVKTEDVSHGTAKRYSMKAVLNGTFSKAEIASIVRQLTAEATKRRYYRSHRVERRWGDSDAHVVWSFVYPSVEDYKNNNRVCGSLWINPSLPTEARPSQFRGENVGDGFVVDWNSNYDLLAGMFSQDKTTKEEYLGAATPLIERLDGLVRYLQAELKALKAKLVTEETFLARSHDPLREVAGIYGQVNDLPGAPYECKEVDELLLRVAGIADTIHFLYSPEYSARWNEAGRLAQALPLVEDAASGMSDLHYELRKVR